MSKWLLKKLQSVDKKKRLLFYVRVLIFSVIGMVVNVGLYAGKVIGEKDLILVTLILSWLALTATFADWIITGAETQDK